MGAGTAHEEPRAQQAATGLAALHRFAVPHLRQGSAPADPLRGAVDRNPGQRARRRDQGADRRAQRPRDRREDVPDPRHLHRHAGHRRQLPAPASSSLFPGRDFKAVTETLHNHGTSSIQYGRGSVLTIDLTNRCNMMCDPCFMDANQVGYVHELTFDDVKKLLDDAISIKPRRQMTVQFSGGEPTHLAALPRGGRLRPQGRLLQRPGGDQRHPLRAGTGVRQGRRRGRPAHRLPAVRRHRRGRQRPPQGRQPVRRQAARDRAPLPGGHRRRAWSSPSSTR